MGAAILDRKSWGPPSWTGSDVKNAKVAPILLGPMSTSAGIYLCFMSNPMPQWIIIRRAKEYSYFGGNQKAGLSTALPGTPFR